MDHLLVHCCLLENIFELFLPSFKRACLAPNNVKEALGKDIIVEPLSLKAKWLLDRLPKVIIWMLWSERIRMVFEG